MDYFSIMYASPIKIFTVTREESGWNLSARITVMTSAPENQGEGRNHSKSRSGERKKSFKEQKWGKEETIQRAEVWKGRNHSKSRSGERKKPFKEKECKVNNK
ncbi:Hypothetical predicted protein [Mytilus galloprovincialis]|uniref:Uncharacterized protein n=1 Tax=Mytilus galloprovincialis TaxID=29158 RepID=A0A8B6GYP0_MYTGA|nr:Hypothetical predicted protein [Mytilus galloprovincialis]